VAGFLLQSHDAKGVTVTSRKMQELYRLVEGIETAMFTTRRRDGHLVSRPMATQVRSPGADFWFVTYQGAAKLAEIARDPHVNLSYYRDRTREWVSVSGIAEASRNRKKIRELYRPDWRAWFGGEGGAKDGGPDDPRMVLIKVRAKEALFLNVGKPQPVVLFELLKGMVTGKRPRLGKTRRARAGDFGTRKGRKKTRTA
jgi:general stress protein 26